MDQWATSNRLGGIQDYTYITEESVKRSLEFGPPMRVKISPTSEYYEEGDPSNPINDTGTVFEFDPQIGEDWCDAHHVRVRWSNNHTNCYRYKDLEIVN